MWLENLKALKTSKGLTTKQIAEQTGLPERTVSRIFSGDTDSPYVDTLHRIVNVLGGSLDSILTDSKAVVGGADTIALQEEIDRLNGELSLVNAENAMLNSKVAALTAENDILRLKLEHKEEIIALHNYYMSRTKGDA